MKIALCHHYSLSHGGGGERILVDAANYLSMRGHDVSIYSLPFRRRGAPFQLSDRVQHIEAPFHKFEADVCYQIYAPLVSQLFKCNAPKIAGLHGAVVADYETGPLDFFKQGVFVAGAYVFRQLVGERALRKFDAIHTVNPEGLPIKHDRIYKIPNWVDCSKSDKLLPMKREKQGKFRVLFVGKPYYIKGFDRFIALSDMMEQDDIEFVATFPPEGQKYANRGRIRCVGHIPTEDVWDLYSTGGVLLHPTRKETFGLVILESLVSGTPVVTTPIPAHAVLNLPLQYASTLNGFSREVKRIYDVWKSDYNSYLGFAEKGAIAARHYDRKYLLPKFEAMLTEVADDRARKS
jgi:glycosyltransferase involved in cell wall biosynthesis